MDKAVVKKTFFFIFIILGQFAFSQAYTKYYLKNIGSVDIPDALELRSGNFNKIMDPAFKSIEKKFAIELNDNRIVFQQKGLNEFSKIGFSDYVRVIIETEYGGPGDYEKARSTITLSTSEISELNSQLKNQINSSFQNTGLTMIKWLGVSMQRINGNIAIKTAYIRQLNSNPPVVVNIYQFHNYDRIYSLTTSFRKEQAAFWIPKMNKIVNSFTIHNIR